MINSNVGSLERKKDLIKNEKTFSGTGVGPGIINDNFCCMATFC